MGFTPSVPDHVGNRRGPPTQSIPFKSHGRSRAVALSFFDHARPGIISRRGTRARNRSTRDRRFVRRASCATNATRIGAGARAAHPVAIGERDDPRGFREAAVGFCRCRAGGAAAPVARGPRWPIASRQAATPRARRDASSRTRRRSTRDDSREDMRAEPIRSSNARLAATCRRRGAGSIASHDIRRVDGERSGC